MQATSTLAMYDLRSPEAWKRGRRERAACGKSCTSIHCLGTDHIIIEYRAGGALEISA